MPEPDYRYSLANERTYLAWVRTGLALIAGGVGLRVFATSSVLMYLTAIGASVLGGILALAAYRHWQRVQQAMTAGDPLPTQWGPLILTIGMVILAGMVTAVVLL